LAILHNESNSLQLANVLDRIPGNGNQISKFPGLNSAHTVLPAQHFRGVGREGTNDIERRQGALQHRYSADLGRSWIATLQSIRAPAHCFLEELPSIKGTQTNSIA
jgi:hypothetical protein